MPICDFLFQKTPLFYFFQSVWRDEAFSYFMAKPAVFQIISQTAHDFNPPFYYLLLHFWLTFTGKSDQSLRLLSFFFYLLTILLAYHFGQKVFSKKFAWFLGIFTMLNPMLLYYAFEIRMYSLYAFLTLASLYFFYRRSWRAYLFATVLGLYTHTFFLLVPFSFGLYLWATKQFKKKKIILTFKPLIFFLPWFPIVIQQFFRSRNSWLFPVDFQLVKSVLGNLFTNFEGTPGHWWSLTALLSFFILIFFLLSLRAKKKLAFLFLLPIFFPLFLILGFSFLRRPVYVNRYLIFVTVFEIMAIALGIYQVKNKFWRFLVIFSWFLFLIFFNLKIVPYHHKTDFKSTLTEINSLANEKDYLFARTPLSFLESAYYYRYPERVFLYNPQNIAIPEYIGITAVFPPTISKSHFYAFSRNFLVNDDASYEIIIQK